MGFPRLQASILSAKEWDSYLRFMRNIALAHTEAANGLQDITEAACKSWGADQPEALQAAHHAAPLVELPPLSLPKYGMTLLPLNTSVLSVLTH